MSRHARIRVFYTFSVPHEERKNEILGVQSDFPDHARRVSVLLSRLALYSGKCMVVSNDFAGIRTTFFL